MTTYAHPNGSIRQSGSATIRNRASTRGDGAHTHIASMLVRGDAMSMHQPAKRHQYRPLWLGCTFTLILWFIGGALVMRYQNGLGSPAEAAAGVVIGLAGWVVLIVAGVWYWRRN